MRHRKRTIKLGRTGAHRDAMLANMVCSLIQTKRVTTTLAKAKAARVLAEKMVTLGKDGSLAARRNAMSRLQQRDSISTLFTDIAPGFAERQGGYTRILKLGRRSSDSSEMAILEWVETGAPDSKPVKKSKPKAKKKAEKKTAPAEEAVAEEPVAEESAAEEAEATEESASSEEPAVEEETPAEKDEEETK